MRARNLIRVAFGVLVVPAALLCFSAPALAAAPETPETLSASGVTATSATLHGLLNPGAASEGGSYQFAYAPSATECTSAGTFDPASPALALGGEKEAESVTVKGLEPSREYAFCIVAYSLSSGLAEPSYGAVVPFKTLALPPAVDHESASVASTAATLEAQVNPENQETTFSFEYATGETAGALSGTVVKLNGEYSLGAGYGDQAANSLRVENLAAGTTYYYRVVTKNASGEEETGSIEHFTTVPVPHTDAATGVTATTAMLHGHLTLDSEETLFSFDYNIGECTNGPSTTPTTANSGTVSIEATGLQPSATYTVCMLTSILTSNISGSELDQPNPPVTFTTPAAPPAIDSEGASSVTPFEATLEAQLNPNNQTTSYTFEYSTTEAAGKLTGTITTLKGASPLSGYGDQTASVTTGHVLAPGTTYHYRVLAENAAHETAEAAGSFPTATAEPPIIDGESTAFLSATSTNLTAQINPNYQATTYTFEYAAGATGKQLVEEGKATTVPGGSIPAGFGDQFATVRLNETLTANTTYYYHVLATNAAGTTPGTVEEFTTSTPPEASTGAAELVGSGTATVSGIVNPDGQETHYSVQYGPTTSYGQNTTSTNAGAETTPVQTGPIHLNTLLPSTTYHYRLVAINALGETTDGADMQFTTTAAPAAPAPPSNGTGEAPAQSTSSTSTAAVFPNLTAITPVPAAKEAGEATPSDVKSLTRAQKLAKALKQCKREKKKSVRVSCEKRAKGKYGSKARKGKRGKKA